MSSELDVDTVTSLPYHDKEYDFPGVAEAVDSLIEAEMSSFAPRSDYLDYLPYPESKGTNMYKYEMARIGKGQTQEPYDAKRYEVGVPSKKADINAWKECISKVETQYETQSNRAINQELLLKYGKQAWLAYIGQKEKQVESLKKQLEMYENEIRVVNLKRMEEQKKAGETLMQLEEQWGGLMSQNILILSACEQEEKEIEILKKKAKSKGIDVTNL